MARPCGHPVITVWTRVVELILHPVTPVSHTKTRDQDLRPRPYAQSRKVVQTETSHWLWRKEAHGINVGSIWSSVLASRLNEVLL